MLEVWRLRRSRIVQNVVPAVLKTLFFIFTTRGNRFGHIPTVTCVHVSDLCCCKSRLTLLEMTESHWLLPARHKTGNTAASLNTWMVLQQQGKWQRLEGRRRPCCPTASLHLELRGAAAPLLPNVFAISRNNALLFPSVIVKTWSRCLKQTVLSKKSPRMMIIASDATFKHFLMLPPPQTIKHRRVNEKRVIKIYFERPFF